MKTSGKINSEWEDYKEKSIPKGCDDEFIFFMSMAFYNGFLRCMNTLAGDDFGPNLVNSIESELIEFRNKAFKKLGEMKLLAEE